MISPEEKDRIRGEIEKRILETKKTIEGLQDQIKPVEPDRAIGRLTRMDAIQQKSMCEATLRKSEESLYRLEEALEKFDEPGFGMCVKCGQAIPMERILIIPESRICVPCASKA